MQAEQRKVGEFLPVNNLRLRRTNAVFVRQDDGALAEPYRPILSSTTCVEDAYDGDVYNANDVDLKARSHCGDNINDASCQFIVLLQFSSVAAL